MKHNLAGGAGPWLRARWAGLSLAALVVAAASARVVIARGMHAPVELCDEFIYSNLARNLADHNGYVLRGVPSHPSYFYPLLIAPAWLARTMSTTYWLAKAIGAVAMTLVAIPVFVWARRLASPGYALLAAALSLLLPAFLFSGLLMTEAASLPTFVLATLAIASMIERPTLLRQAAVLGAIVLAAGIRVQAIVLVPVIPTAVLFKVLLDLRNGAGREDLRAELRRLWPIFTVLVVGGLAFVVYKRATGQALATGLGGYQALGQTHYPPGPTAHWAVRHLAELGLAVGLVPLAALIVLGWLAVAGSASSRAERAFLAVVPATMLWVLLEVGAFAATVRPIVFERYTFYLAPLLMLAFVVWLARGLPRPLVGTVVAVVIPPLLILTLNLASVVNDDAIDGVTMAAFNGFSTHLPGSVGELRWGIFAGAVLGAFLFALCERNVARVALPALLAAYLVAASVPPLDKLHSTSRLMRAAAGSDAGWVVRAVGRGRHALYVNTPGGLAPANVLLATEFWNPNVVGVYNVQGTSLCELPETPTTTDGSTGEITPPVPQGVDYAIADRNLPFAGRLVATGGPVDQPLALYRVPRSLRVGEITSGVYGDGWMGSEASYSRFAPAHSPGRVSVSVGRQGWGGPDVPGAAVIRVGKPDDTESGLARVETVRTIALHRLAGRTFTFHVARLPVRVVVTVAPTFSPSQFGLADTRILGAQVSFGFAPG